MSSGVTSLCQMIAELEELKKEIERKNDPALTASIGSHVNAIISYGMDVYSEVSQILGEFETLQQDEKLSLDQKKELLAQNLDYFKTQISDYERDAFASACKEEYKDIWDDLDNNSKEFLVTARYLGYALRMRGKGNYAPVINEMCRVFENELKTKIYDDYIINMTQKQVVDMDETVDSIKKAVSKKRKNRDYFISDTEMVSYIEKIPHYKSNRSGYIYELKKYLESGNWNIQKLSDAQYMKLAYDYIDNYRNESAHANLMDDKKADNCNKKTQKIVKHLITSHN